MSSRAFSANGPTSTTTLLDYLAADDDGFDVRGAGAHDEGGWTGVAEAVEVGCAHVDDRHVGVLADGQAADLRVEMPCLRTASVASRSMSR